jgi:hypothetical protein
VSDGRQGRAFVFDGQPARPREERVWLGRARYHLRHEVAHSEAAGGADLNTVITWGVTSHVVTGKKGEVVLYPSLGPGSG